MAELSSGWIGAQREGPLAEYPSQSQDRIFWLAPSSVLTKADLDEALAAARRLDRPGMYIWLAPWAWNEEVEAMLTSAGAALCPWVEHLALARAAGACTVERLAPFEVRAMSSADGDEVMEIVRRCEPWYSLTAVRTVEEMLRLGGFEFHAALEGGEPAALGLMALDGDWAYLFAAATAPEARRRGAQTALIASRVERAAALGSKWCSCETNTAVATSLNNLHRVGFADAISWRVYRWSMA